MRIKTLSGPFFGHPSLGGKSAVASLANNIG